MPVSPYFRIPNYEDSIDGDKQLLEDIITESITIQGHDAYYILRESFDEGDLVFGEYSKSAFKKAYRVEVYINDVEKFEGDGDYFSKFGLEIRDQSSFVVSRRTFRKLVPQSLRGRPREGDLLYLPVMHRMFELKFVEEENFHFALDKKMPYVWEMKCELFRASHEPIDTGVEVVDHVAEENSYTIKINLDSGMGDFQKHEIVYQSNTNYANSYASAEVKEWNSPNNYIMVFDVKGEFVPGVTITGNTSGAIYTVHSVDDRTDFSYYDLYDNVRVEEEAQQILDFSEKNPFGTP